MNILKQELRMSFRSWFYFTVSMLAILIVFASFFNTFKNDAQLLDQLLQNFPQEFKVVFGFADVRLSEPEGYFSFVVSYIVLIGAVFAMKLGISLLSEETRAKTSDFLLTRPIKRSQIVNGKFLATIILLILQNLLLLIGGYLAVNRLMSGGMDWKIFTLLSLSTFFVQLFFVGVGMLLAVALPKVKSVMAITLGVVFFFFIIELVNQSLMERKLTYLTPFSYFKGSVILSNRGYDIIYLMLDLAMFMMFSLLSYWLYNRKDFHSI